MIFNLLATTLVMILYRTLHKLIGRNWLKDSGLSTYGISTIPMELTSCDNSSPPKTLLTINNCLLIRHNLQFDVNPFETINLIEPKNDTDPLCVRVYIYVYTYLQL